MLKPKTPTGVGHTGATQRTAQPGRPPMPESRTAEILGTVIDLLGENGYDQLTMEQVAAGAKCGKATLYRNWKDKKGLVVAAIGMVAPDLVDVNTGSLRGDLRELVGPLGEAEVGPVIQAEFLHLCLVHPELGDTVREALLAPSVEIMETIVNRAVDRGELAVAPTVTPVLQHLLFGVSLGRPAITGLPADVDYLHTVIDTVILPAIHAGATNESEKK